MARRGRPETNGLKPDCVLVRSVIVLSAFDKARARGEKLETAITESVAAVLRWFPTMPISTWVSNGPPRFTWTKTVRR